MNYKPKSWFTTIVLVSVVTIVVIWLYNINLDHMVQSDSAEINRSTITEMMTKLITFNKKTDVKLSPQDQLQEDRSGSKQLLEEQPNRTSDEEFKKRRQRINKVCSTSQVSGNVSLVMTDKQAGVIYCYVPKAGCTFWKRIFTAVNSESNDTLLYSRSNDAKEVISSLSRETVHNSTILLLKYNDTDFTNTKYPTRFIVTRDPFSRLLSSYLDKYYLPDFWMWQAPRIRETLSKHSSSNKSQDFLRNHFNEIANKFQNKLNINNTRAGGESKCGKYMTFSEFVESGLWIDEAHSMPIHKICNPCKFDATHISRMETFSADARVLLSQMKLENIMDSLDEHAQIDEEISSISLYNFHHFYRNKTLTFYKPCLSPTEIAYRLWHNFRWRGYINPDIDYKLPQLTDLNDIEADFMVQVRAARKSGLQNIGKMKAAKNEFKKKAFLSISKAMFEKLSQTYAVDFELFGFTEARDELYSYYSS